MAKRITLFTSFSPKSGGGGTNLRTLVPHLEPEALRVRWLYTAERDQDFSGATWIGPALSGGPIFRDLPRTAWLWMEHETARLREIIDRLCDDASDGFWVVGHHEGALVARALVARGKPVHLTVQDDVPDGMFARSARYRWMAALVRPLFYDLLAGVPSFDVTSDGMRRYYRYLVNRDSVVVHPYADALPVNEPAPGQAQPHRQQTLTVGHIGTLYNIDEWRAFMTALKIHAASLGLGARMIMIGLAEKFHASVSQEVEPGAAATVEIFGNLAEDDAVARLAQSDFMYAMYPFDSESDVFRRTSLPTKLTTYLKCRRPIFAHTPVPSSMAELVDRFALGAVCASAEVGLIRQDIARILGNPVGVHAFELARASVYGRDNVDRLQAALVNLPR